jgi:hypothetical protein
MVTQSSARWLAAARVFTLLWLTRLTIGDFPRQLGGVHGDAANTT